MKKRKTMLYYHSNSNKFTHKIIDELYNLFWLNWSGRHYLNLIVMFFCLNRPQWSPKSKPEETPSNSPKRWTVELEENAISISKKRADETEKAGSNQKIRRRTVRRDVSSNSKIALVNPKKNAVEPEEMRWRTWRSTVGRPAEMRHRTQENAVEPKEMRGRTRRGAIKRPQRDDPLNPKRVPSNLKRCLHRSTRSADGDDEPEEMRRQTRRGADEPEEMFRNRTQRDIDKHNYFFSILNCK